jgi:hypothetical protein
VKTTRGGAGTWRLPWSTSTAINCIIPAP